MSSVREMNNKKKTRRQQINMEVSVIVFRKTIVNKLQDLQRAVINLLCISILQILTNSFNNLIFLIRKHIFYCRIIIKCL